MSKIISIVYEVFAFNHPFKCASSRIIRSVCLSINNFANFNKTINYRIVQGEP